MLGIEELSQKGRATVNKARRLERFLTQPFFTTEQFTGQEGRSVSVESTVAGCERLLAFFRSWLPMALSAWSRWIREHWCNVVRR